MGIGILLRLVSVAFVWLAICLRAAPTAWASAHQEQVSVGFHAYSLSEYIIETRLTSIPDYVLNPERVHFSLRDIDGRTSRAVPAVFREPSFQTNGDLLTPFYDVLIYLKLALPQVPPGAYQVVATFDRGFVSLPNGAPIVVATPAPNAVSFGIHTVSLYFPDIPRRAPAAGDRYLILGGMSGCPQTGEVYRARVADIWHVAPEQALEPTRKHQPRFPLQCVGSGGSYDGILARLVEDPNLQKLRAEFVGKPLWTYGPFRFGCSDDTGGFATVQSRNRAPLTIARIERVSQYFIRRALGSDDYSYYCGGGCHDWYHVFTDDPLIVFFSAMDSSTLEIVPWRTFSGPSRALYNGRCAHADRTFIDAWDLERTFTTDDPRAGHDDWDPAFRAAMLDYRLMPGMTKQMVALAHGFPAVFGAAAELYRLDDWRGPDDRAPMHFANGKLEPTK